VECMACSDNVIRAGLTPKEKDVKRLVELLSYRTYSPSQVLFSSTRVSANVESYEPPVPDFAVDKIQTLENFSKEPIPLGKIDSASILIVISGTGTVVTTSASASQQEHAVGSGTVLFVSANTGVDVRSHCDLVMYRARCGLGK